MYIRSYRTRSEACSIGGKIMAGRQRQKAIENYNISPNICKQCLNPISVKTNQKVCDVREKQFCNHSCASRFFQNKMNTGPRRQCTLCLKPLATKYRQSGPLKQICFSCHPKEFARTGNKTKAEVTPNTISYNARHVFSKLGVYSCQAPECAYTLHIEVCHRQAIYTFPKTALLKEINRPENLIGLCPNHHWEFDHKLLTL